MLSPPLREPEAPDAKSKVERGIWCTLSAVFATTRFGAPSRGARAARFIAAAGAAAALTSPHSATSQEIDGVTKSAEQMTGVNDDAVLAELGLALATLDQSNDVPLLWRAVRKFVLTGRVSVETQRRILRRVWLADPTIVNGSKDSSQSH